MSPGAIGRVLINDGDCHRDGDSRDSMVTVSVHHLLAAVRVSELPLSANLNFIEAELLRSGTEWLTGLGAAPAGGR